MAVLEVTRFASRKFLLALIVLIAATIALFSGDLSGTLWRDVVLGTCGVYLAANVAQKATSKEPVP